VHLVSSFAYPKLNFITPEMIVDHLKQAPAIVRHTSPMYWTFLDAPQDGTLLLVWQSQQSDAFPTDGYLYTDLEEVMAMEVKGYVRRKYQQLSIPAPLPFPRICLSKLLFARLFDFCVLGIMVFTSAC
jgi:hypothetical protein